MIELNKGRTIEGVKGPGPKTSLQPLSLQCRLRLSEREKLFPQVQTYGLGLAALSSLWTI